ncbi:hypothetical protein H5J25_12895 [Sphingomonas aliaeris]|uniref:Cupin domain-containing protein n=1 Tax=Sphingomonas aliaeris TaxID=2759526 RepID=A0A974NT13_9SPHN|nr:hypothetical protein [Sphingomonas aliaeris]QQV76371.1 hypothetical protein H5J25_12895 [Sphingomonas aliaeris]
MKLMLVALVLSGTVSAGPAPDLDAVVAAPGNHKILLENDQVRVLQVEVAPGETEPVHEHRWPSVLHIQDAQPSVDISYELRGGNLVEIGRRALPGGRPPPHSGCRDRVPMPSGTWAPRRSACSASN